MTVADERGATAPEESAACGTDWCESCAVRTVIVERHPGYVVVMCPSGCARRWVNVQDAALVKLTAVSDDAVFDRPDAVLAARAAVAMARKRWLENTARGS